MYLALGSERSEFQCLPEEMLARLDRFPDAVGQLNEAWDWYERISERRADERLWDKILRAKGPPINDDALTEVNTELDRRASERGTTPDEELDRLKQKFKD